MEEAEVKGKIKTGKRTGRENEDATFMNKY